MGNSPQPERFEGEGVRGFLHRPRAGPSDVLVVTHGAGSDCNSPLLVALASALCESGVTVLRMDLPFRQRHQHGPPFPAAADQDREGLRRSVEAVRPLVEGRVFLGGHSYGGRQASMLAAGEPSLIDGLLLLSYPLHPPRRQGQLRTAHFPALRNRALFVHGSRDPFGSLEEIESAMKLIPAATTLVRLEGAGHDLFARRAALTDCIGVMVKEFHEFLVPAGLPPSR